MSMKIVRASNFDDEMFAESLVAENIQVETLGAIMVEALNKTLDEHSHHYFKFVQDDYKLYKFEP